MNRDTLSSRFSAGRVMLLARNRAYDDAPGLGIGLAIVAGLNLLSILIADRAFMNSEGDPSYAGLIIISGLILSSQAFKGMHGRTGADWILLPATPLEKYAAAFVSYLVVFPLVAAAAATGLSFVLALVERAAGGPGTGIWHPISLAALRSYGEYAVVAVAFLAGSAAFRKRAFLKTAGLSVAFVLLCSLVVYLGLSLVHEATGSRGFSVSYDSGSLTVLGGDGPGALSVERKLRVLVDVVRLALVPAFSIAFGYLRVAEKEARDEVQ